MQRKCPFTGCVARIDPALFACRKHWHSLADADRARLVWAYGEWRKGDLTSEDLRTLQQEVLGKRGTA